MCLLFFYTIRVDPQNFDFRPKIHFFPKHRLSRNFQHILLNLNVKKSEEFSQKHKQFSSNLPKNQVVQLSGAPKKGKKSARSMWSFFCSFTIKAFPLFSCSFADFGTLQINRYVAAPTTSGTYCLNNIWSPSSSSATAHAKYQEHSPSTLRVYVTCWKYSGTKVFLPYFLISKEKKKSRVGLQYMRLWISFSSRNKKTEAAK